MNNLVQNELYKLIRRKKIYIFSFLILVITFLNAISSYLINREGVGIVFTGQAFPATLLDSLATLAIPIMLIVIVSDMITGEFAEGSIKLSLTRAISRKELIFGKIIALSLIILYFLLLALIFSYILGFFIFGFGNNFTLKGISLNTLGGIGFTLALYLFTSLPLLAFSMIITFLAVTFNNEGIVIGIGITLLVILGLLTSVFFDIAPFLINNYFNMNAFFTSGVSLGDLVFALIVIFIYGIIFSWVSILIFERKDIFV